MASSTEKSDQERDEITRAFGANLRRFRKKAGLTQGELAEQAGLHVNYISGADRGERNLSLVNIVKLARALGVSASDLLEGVE